MSELDKFRPNLPLHASRSQLPPRGQEAGAVRQPLSIQEVIREYATPRQTVSRCLLLFDATGSMQPYWDHVKRTIEKVVDRLLGATGTPLLKIVAYRDDCDGERLIEPSSWCSRANDLRQFLGRIWCDGGGDAPEAVDRALQAALEEQGTISGIVLIGDAPPHPNREGLVEARALGAQKRPVYPIVVGQSPDTRRAFNMIASLSGGRMLELDHLEDLDDILGVVIARSMGDEIFDRYLNLHDRQLSPGARKAAGMLTDGGKT